MCVCVELLEFASVSKPCMEERLEPSPFMLCQRLVEVRSPVLGFSVVCAVAALLVFHALSRWLKPVHVRCHLKDILTTLVSLDTRFWGRAIEARKLKALSTQSCQGLTDPTDASDRCGTALPFQSAPDTPHFAHLGSRALASLSTLPSTSRTPSSIPSSGPSTQSNLNTAVGMLSPYLQNAALLRAMRLCRHSWLSDL